MLCIYQHTYGRLLSCRVSVDDTICIVRIGRDENARGTLFLSIWVSLKMLSVEYVDKKILTKGQMTRLKTGHLSLSGIRCSSIKQQNEKERLLV